jgi:hypothetical protein
LQTTEQHHFTPPPYLGTTNQESKMKKLVTIAITFAAVGILATALTGAANDEKPSSSESVSSKSSADLTKPCCQARAGEANKNVVATGKNACCDQKQAKGTVLAKAESCNGDSCQSTEKAKTDCQLCAKETAGKSADKAAVPTSTTGKPQACGECQGNDASAGKPQCAEGDISKCGGKCELGEATVPAAATDGLQGKDCPDQDGKGDCAKCAAAKPAAQAASASKKKCESCSEEICPQECSSCAEARSAAAQGDPKAAAHGPGKGMGRGRAARNAHGHGHAGDSQHDKDHQDFFFLIEHRDSIRRSVKNVPNGIESLTESDVPAVAEMIQVHVEAMYDRVENGNPIRMRDPIFRAIFAHADKIKMDVEHTEQGVRVTETSTDAYVVKLLQEHAKVVSLWIKNGYAELPKNHAAPQK